MQSLSLCLKTFLPKPVWRSCFCLGGSKTCLQRKTLGASIYCLRSFVNSIGTQEYTWVSNYDRNIFRTCRDSLKTCCRDLKFLRPSQLFYILLLLPKQYWWVLKWKSCSSWKLLQEESDYPGREFLNGTKGNLTATVVVWRLLLPTKAHHQGRRATRSFDAVLHSVLHNVLHSVQHGVPHDDCNFWVLPTDKCWPLIAPFSFSFQVDCCLSSLKSSTCTYKEVPNKMCNNKPWQCFGYVVVYQQGIGECPCSCLLRRRVVHIETMFRIAETNPTIWLLWASQAELWSTVTKFLQLFPFGITRQNQDNYNLVRDVGMTNVVTLTSGAKVITPTPLVTWQIMCSRGSLRPLLCFW